MNKKVLFLFFVFCFKVYGASITFSSQSPKTILIDTGTSVTVNATVSTVTGEEAYLVYTTDDWAGKNYVYATWNYPDVSFEIPAQSAGTYVEYYLTILDAKYENNGTEIAWDSNGGANYGYCVPDGKTIILKYKNETATTVQLEGTFSLTKISDGVFEGTYDSGDAGWSTTNGYLFKNDGSGNWTITLTLNYHLPVTYEYKFYVDSQWLNDPRNLDDKVGTEGNNQFTINTINNAPVITLSFPNGDELISGTTNINWSASDPDGDTVTVDIYYSADGGTSWNLISRDEANDGLYAWDTTKVSDGAQYLIKVQGKDGYLSSSDQSDKVFTIQNANNPPAISLTQPDGDEQVSGNYEIKWTATDSDGDTVTVDIYYSSDSGTNFTLISSGETNDGSYIWDTTSVSDGANYRIKLVATDGSLSSSDVSSSDFEVRNSTQNLAPSITLTYPEGGETLSGNQTITWVSDDPEGDLLDIKIEYSSDGGSNWNEITTLSSQTAGAGSYSWDTTALDNGSNYKIEVTADDGENSVSDESGVFSISNSGTNAAPVISLTYPKGGETLSGIVDITWSASDPDNDTVTLNLYLSSDGGLNFTAIDSEISNSGSYSFNTAGYSDGTNYVLKIVATDGTLSSFDISQAFTIANGSSLPQLKFTTTSTTISTGTVFDVDVEVANSSDVYGANLNIEYPSSLLEVLSVSTGSFLGSNVVCLSKDFSSSGYLNTGLTKLGNVSGSSGSGTLAKISFRAKTSGITTLAFKNTTKMRDSSLSEIEFQPVSLSLTLGTGENFPASVTLTSPNGGESVSGSYTIKWTASDTEGADLLVTLEYTSDKTTYYKIASNISNTGSYSWDTTSVSDGTYWIRITVYDGSQYSSDLSDASFTIYNGSGNKAPQVTLISPVGGEMFSKKALIVWNATDSDGDELTITLEYSDDGGTTYNTIASGLSNTSSYIWDISSLQAGSNYLVKITASDGSVSTSQRSDEPFTIALPSSNNSPQVVVTSPNGGETLGQDYSIFWLTLDPDGDLIKATTIWYSSSGDTSTWVEVYKTTESITSYLWDTRQFSEATAGLLKIAIFDGVNWSFDITNASFILTNEVPRIIGGLSVSEETKKKAILSDFGVSKSTSNGLKLVFSKAMNTQSVEYNFTLVREDTNEVIKGGTFIWSSDKKELTYQLPSGTKLSPNTDYKVVINIGTFGAQDEAGNPLEATSSDGLRYEWEFTTAMSSSTRAIVSGEGAVLNFPAGSFSGERKVFVSKTKASAIVPSGLSEVLDESYVFVMREDSNSDGVIDEEDCEYTGNFLKNVEISIPYTDENEDGIVDEKGVDVSSLKVYRLVSGNWLEVNDGTLNEVDTSSKVVRCEVTHFSTYTILGKLYSNTSLSKTVIYPNPFYPEDGEVCNFEKLADNSQVKIFDLSGNFVKELSVNQILHSASWDGTSSNKKKVSSGIYIYLITSPSGNRKGKIGLIR